MLCVMLVPRQSYVSKALKNTLPAVLTQGTNDHNLLLLMLCADLLWCRLGWCSRHLCINRRACTRLLHPQAAQEAADVEVNFLKFYLDDVAAAAAAAFAVVT